MTDQEIFDKVWAHIIAQGVPSMNGEGRCLYRGPNGTKCAAGIFLPDDARVWEGFPWDELPHGELGTPDNDIIQDLQYCHDGASDTDDFLADFKRRARKVAAEYNVEVPE